MRRLPEDLCARLRHLEARLGARASLAPGRPRALGALELLEQLAPGTGSAEQVCAFLHGLCDVLQAVSENFPDNVFWDVDYLARCMWDEGSPEGMAAFARRVVGLCHGFGNKSALRFRYAHDFLFGYDWARWVTRQPGERAGIGPFDTVFLDHLEARRNALLELIASNDAKYSQLQGAEYRNPFTFSREPDEEERLHLALARNDLIPVKMWRLDGERRWDLPFTDLRAEEARRLGLPSRGAAS